MPLVKAVQEQQKIIEAQKNDIEVLKVRSGRVDKLETELAELTEKVNKLIKK